ncbi:Drug/Metabolite transporter (DMT) Superfamily [Phytophthora cinnamomi]|uniref:Drug/Metabolite transporter (DMT) Superfamily n=1 Tax=Phytophthora cinnamomi TaxID=4785 RepID=UPI003559D1EB|nr:Drug/Metabolite transporter (DMT) Superfamily [Phytophthora cinnamomi]
MIAPIRSELKSTGNSGPTVRVQVSGDDESVANEAPSASESSPSLVKASSTASVEYGGARGWRSPQTLALGYIAFAAFNLSLMRACVKFASRQVTSHETVLWRSSVAWLLNLVLVHRERVALAVAPKHRNMLFWRCFFGTFGISIQFYAMAQMVLTDAVTIIFTSPIVTFMLGALVLGEAIERLDLLSCLVSYVGVVFVTRPAFLFATDEETKEVPPLAIVCALGGSVMQACSYIAMRQLRELNYVVINHYFLLFGLLYALVTLWYFDVSFTMPNNITLMAALFGSGLFAFVGQVFLTMGFQQSKAGIASVMRYLDVVFVLVWDIVLLDENVSMYSVIGAAIIIASASFIVLPKKSGTKAKPKAVE